MSPVLSGLLAAAAFVEPPRLGGARAVRKCDTRCNDPTAMASNVLLVDHLNINHERGRHDLLCAFYFDVLGCAADPRKADNLASGRKTIWANAGISQFHLPEADTAQVFDGVITLTYADLSAVRARLASPPPVLAGSAFRWETQEDDALCVADPWGTSFRLVEGAADVRGMQPGPPSESFGIADLTVHVAEGADLHGVGRFYRDVLGCEATLSAGEERLEVRTSPSQTLSFVPRGGDAPSHAELSTTPDGQPCNHGAHISLYLADMASAYRRASDLGVTYVNHRFKRRAYTQAR